jgi:Response regulator containing CheY-like receiver, AAA-type ATPase, and DNA-binding domains
MVQISDFLPGKTRLLIVEDDSDLRLTLCEYMETRRFSLTSAKSGTEALRLSTRENSSTLFYRPDDAARPQRSRSSQGRPALNPRCYVVIMTGYSSIDSAIESIRLGAFDYLPKPFQLVEIEIIANRIIEHLCLLEDNRRLSRKLLSLNEDYATIDARLQNIEAMIGSLSSNLLESQKH